MHRAATLLFVLASSVVSASDLRTRGRATEAYHQRLSEIIDSLPALTREKLAAYGGAAVHYSFVPIYSVYINDRDNAGVTWCNNGVQTVTPVERVKGHWQLSTTVIERIITTGANFPT
jgi:hypothetical protein